MMSFIVLFFTTKMKNFGSPPHEYRNSLADNNNNISSAVAQGGNPHAKPALLRTTGGFLDVRPCWFGKAAWGKAERNPTKLLLNVNLQNSLGPVQVVMLPENTVHDLKRAVVEIYVREKRRPFLGCADPRSFVLHYSPFSLEGLNPEEKLKNLGSRNFFLCQKPGNSTRRRRPSYLEEANAAHKSPFPFVKLMDFLL